MALKLGSSGEIVYQPPMSSPRGIASVSIILIAAVILAFVPALVCGVAADLITAIATVVLACGTLLLAFVAIFSDTVRGRLYKPILEVSMKPEPPDCVAVPTAVQPLSCGNRQQWVVTCRSEFTRPARHSSREQTFAHWRRGMGSQSSFRQPGLAHSVRQKRHRRGDEKSGKRAAKLSFHAATRA